MVAVLGGVGARATFAALCAILLAVAISLAGPAWSQASDSGPLVDKPAIGRNLVNPSNPPDVAVIAAQDCRVDEDAFILLEDGDGTRARFTNGRMEITITADANQVRIEGPDDNEDSRYIGDHATYPTSDNDFDTDGAYRVVSSTGITCRGAGNAQDDGASDDQYPDQYDDFEDLAAGDLIINVPNKPLPDTGGAPAGLAVAGCAMILLGASLLGAVFRGRD